MKKLSFVLYSGQRGDNLTLFQCLILFLSMNASLGFEGKNSKFLTYVKMKIPKLLKFKYI